MNAESPEFLRSELLRKDKIIKSLMDRFEREMDAQSSEFGLFETTVMLDGEVRERTRALEATMNDLRQANIALDKERGKVETIRTQLAEAIASMSEGFVLFDAGGRVVLSNAILGEIWGSAPATRGETRPALAARLANAGSLVSADREWLAASGAEWPRSIECRLASGTWVRVSERLTADGGIVATHADISDIKARESRRREAELAEKSVLLQATLDNLLQGVAVFDRDSRLSVWNPLVAPMLGLPPDLLRAGLHYDDFAVHDPVLRPLAEAVRGDVCAQHFEQTRIDGTILSGHCAGMPGGGFILTYSDITEQRRAELVLYHAKDELERRVVERTRELRASEERFRDIAASASDWFWETDAELRFSYVSDHFFDATGADRQLVIGKHRWDLFEAGFLTSHPPHDWRQNRADMEAQRAFRNFEYCYRRRDGSTATLRVTGRPCYDENGGFIGYRGTGSDVSLLVQAQEELLRSEKLAGLGGLVAGVAHEINTPIGIGLTAASHLADRTHEFATAFATGTLRRSEMDVFVRLCDETTASLVTNLRRAADLVRSFKRVAVDQSSEHKRRIVLADYVAEILLSLQPRLKRTQHVVDTAIPPTLSLYCDPGAISQILTNLVMNSLIHGFAGKEAGRITIGAEALPGEVRLVYHDDGCGMPPEVAAHVFEPFYTTRRGQGGSGLGLYLVYTLATQTLEGRIACATLPGEGVTFTLSVPDKPETPEMPEDAADGRKLQR